MTGGDEHSMHGGVKFYRGSVHAARSHVEADHSRADDCYLAEGSGVAEHYVVTVRVDGMHTERRPDLDGASYERWVAGYDVATGQAKGRLRDDDHALRFVEVVVNGPKTWSLAAALHPEIAAAYEDSQTRAAGDVISRIAQNATTRVGPRGRQVQGPVRSRLHSSGTTPPAPATRTDTSTSRSSPVRRRSRIDSRPTRRQMLRRHSNVADHVAGSVEGAHRQWVEAFSRGRADLRPGLAAIKVDEDIGRYGTQIPDEAWGPEAQTAASRAIRRCPQVEQQRGHGIGRSPS